MDDGLGGAEVICFEFRFDPKYHSLKDIEDIHSILVPNLEEHYGIKPHGWPVGCATGPSFSGASVPTYHLWIKKDDLPKMLQATAALEQQKNYRVIG